MYRAGLREKRSEAMAAVLPIVGIVLALSLLVTPMPAGILLSFLFGAALLVLGMMLFSLGAELAMEPMGARLGARITRTKKLWLVLGSGFLLGLLITVSEPDLQVLAHQVTAVPNAVLIGAVAVGVGLFLTLALLRMLLGVPLRTVLLVFYALVLGLAFLLPGDFLAVAFDAGGVTTGPMTVPFIMSFGVGIAAIRSDRRASDDSFGLVALCSVGPVLAVMLLGWIYRPDSADYTAAWLPDVRHSLELRELFWDAFPAYLGEMARALLPILVVFALFQLLTRDTDRRGLGRIGIGLVYTYLGLTLFLTGANVGFMPAGTYLGERLAGLPQRWVIVPLGMVMGFFIVRAEPAVYVLMKQAEELTDGAISGAALRRSLSSGVAVSVGLAMVRVLTGVPILWLIVPGYLLALGLSFAVPPIFTAIAFDSGGVASGPMTAAFLLPFAMGACGAVGGNVVTDAFGVVAMVAMTPLIAIQGLGLSARLRRRSRTETAAEIPDTDAIIEL